MFTVKRTRLLSFEKLKLTLEERIAVDEHGNLCVGFAGQLMDGELWATGHRVGAEKWTDTGKKTAASLRIKPALAHRYERPGSRRRYAGC